MRAWLGNKAWPAIALVGTALLLVRVHDFGLLGLDTLACIETSRIRSWEDLAGTFDERLMTTHNFYRPLQDLSIAWDHALWGLEASGYQLTSVICFGLTAAALGLLLARMLGPPARFGHAARSGHAARAGRTGPGRSSPGRGRAGAVPAAPRGGAGGPGPRGYIRWITASANSLHLTSVAPCIRRAKS